MNGAARSASPVLALLAFGWIVIAAAGLAFMSATSAERGFAFWLVAFTLAGSAATLIDGARAGGNNGSRRDVSERQYLEPLMKTDPRERLRRRQRIAGKLVGALVMAPVLALVVSALWQLAGPGTIVDRIVVSGFLMMAVFAGALVYILFVKRPWLANLMLGAPTVAASCAVAALLYANGAAS